MEDTDLDGLDYSRRCAVCYRPMPLGGTTCTNHDVVHTITERDLRSRIKQMDNLRARDEAERAASLKED